MRVLGIDPGIGRLGWGIIEKNKSVVTAISYGCIETPAGESIEKRLFTLYGEITKILKEFKPESFAVEELFFNTNAKTAFAVGQARGVVLLCGAQYNLEAAVYTPLQVKMALTGYGRAEKSQIGQMVKILLKLDKIPKPDDTADALAIALTHAFTRK
jgi:crossover junction endodeoxyribonuclease RuvC